MGKWRRYELRKEEPPRLNIHQKHTKGFALVIPLLPPRAQERGAEKLPHPPERRLDLIGAGQVCAPPVLPFAACGEAAHDEPGARHLT